VWVYLLLGMRNAKFESYALLSRSCTLLLNLRDSHWMTVSVLSSCGNLLEFFLYFNGSNQFTFLIFYYFSSLNCLCNLRCSNFFITMVLSITWFILTVLLFKLIVPGWLLAKDIYASGRYFQIRILVWIVFLLAILWYAIIFYFAFSFLAIFFLMS
jgi:hypothetical protein